MKKHSKKQREDIDEDDEKKPYGWILVLRGIARAAILLKKRPHALRVLCVAAEYMNQDGQCRISQDTIAARLGLTRQAVNLQMKFLDEEDILISGAPKDGVLKNYILETDGLEDERFDQELVDIRRAAKRAAKKGKYDPDKVKPKASAAKEEGASIDTPSDNVCPFPSNGAANPDANRFKVGDAVRHRNFGNGIVVEVDGKKCSVRFGDAIERKVVAEYLEGTAA